MKTDFFLFIIKGNKLKKYNCISTNIKHYYCWHPIGSAIGSNEDSESQVEKFLVLVCTQVSEKKDIFLSTGLRRRDYNRDLFVESFIVTKLI